MAERIERVPGTEVVLESSGALLADNTLLELTDDDLQLADVGGNFTATFEFDALGTFSGAPTAGNQLVVYEQKINSDGTDGPDVTTSYLKDRLFAWEFPATDAAHYLRKERVPINRSGAKYWIKWNDGGSGTVSISATWAMRVIVEKIQTETV